MKLKAGFWIGVLLLLNIVTAHAQANNPCLGDDPDATCPLDTWVIVLVIAAAIFTAFSLYRRQRPISSSTN
jgi:hypothetical protein